jgi:hypothetical protein
LRGGRTGAVGRNNDGPNVGMGQPLRALREALATVPMTGLATETVGLAASAWPSAWIGAFSDDPRGLATGATYLRTVAPIFGFFRIGYVLYCAGDGNAARVEAKGADVRLPPTASAAEIAAAVSRLITEPHFRIAARRLGDAIKADLDKSAITYEMEAIVAARRGAWTAVRKALRAQSRLISWPPLQPRSWQSVFLVKLANEVGY